MSNYNNNFWGELMAKSNNKTVACINEWRFYSYYGDFEDGDVCICGKDIHKLFGIINKENHNTLTVGSSCVKKFMPNVHNEYKNKIKEIKEEVKTINKFFKGHKCDHCKLYYKKKHICLFDRLTEVSKKRLEDESYKEWVFNLEERRGQADIYYNFILNRRENISYNNKQRRRLKELNAKLNNYGDDDSSNNSINETI